MRRKIGKEQKNRMLKWGQVFEKGRKEIRSVKFIFRSFFVLVFAYQKMDNLQ